LDRRVMGAGEGGTMAVAGRLEIRVAGEQWRPVRTLALCGPEDRCFAVDVDDDGGARILFGDGVTGQRPRVGEAVEVIYRRGAGKTVDVPPKGSPPDVDATLVELFAQIGDLLRSVQDQVASEAYLETASGRSRVVNSTELRRAIAASRGEIGICITFHARSSHRHSRRRGHGVP
jgi:hypothetical protein